MKKILSLFLVFVLVLAAFAGCETSDRTENPGGDTPGGTTSGGTTSGGTGTPPDPTCTHADANDDGKCDNCAGALYVNIDIYAINDLHGKFKDTASNVGVDELTTYLKNCRKDQENTIFLSSGDMWQGTPESNLTRGKIITDWMNELDFASMTIGNHEFDWGEEYIEANNEIADFPFLAINVYDKNTNQRVDYCRASTVVEYDGIQVGIIGAIGDCYSSISGDHSGGFTIKTGDALTRLVKDEAARLRGEGVDFIIYSLHDGYGSSSTGKKNVGKSDLASYYDTSLSNGYIDLVFEGHTHQRYVLVDEYGVYHLQNGGENQGISRASVRINPVTGTTKTTLGQFVSNTIYSAKADDPIVNTLLKKYEDVLADADAILGDNAKKRYSSEIKQKVAELYYQYAEKVWGDKYDIVLGGGYLTTRNPYDLAAGQVAYGDLYAVLPFDNNLVLCSISGYDLKTRFFETDNSNYYIYYESYGASVRDNIDLDATYYIIVDSYSSTYKPNRLTEIARISEAIYARDLLAEFIRSGGWETAE